MGGAGARPARFVCGHRHSTAARPATDRFRTLAKHIFEKQAEQSKKHGYVCGCPLATLGSEMAGEETPIIHHVQAICDIKLAYYENALRDLVAEGALPAETDVKRKADEILALIVGQMAMARIRNDLTPLQTNLEIGLMELIGLDLLTDQSIDMTLKDLAS